MEEEPSLHGTLRRVDEDFFSGCRHCLRAGVEAPENVIHVLFDDDVVHGAGALAADAYDTGDRVGVVNCDEVAVAVVELHDAAARNADIIGLIQPQILK